MVEKITAPVGISKVVQAIQTAFEVLPWLETVYPLTQVGIVERNNTKVRIPVVYRNDATSYQIELYPDVHKMSFGFFEQEGASTARTDLDSPGSNVEHNLNFVFWGKLDKIDAFKGYDFRPELVDDVLNILQDFGVYEYSYDLRNESVFSKYDYDQSEKQFLLWPYGGFKVNFSFRESFCY